MQTLKYGSSAFDLTLDYPSKWKVENISDIKVQIKNSSTGTSLLDSTSAETFSGNVLSAATARAMTLAVTSSVPPTIGKRYRIHETSETGAAKNEDIFVIDYTVTATDQYSLNLKEELKYAHAQNEDVQGCFAKYTADISDSSDFALGTECLIIWTPDSNDFAYRKTAMVLNQDSGIGNAWNRLSVRFPGAYEVISKWSTEELYQLEEVLENEFIAMFRRKGLNIAVIQNQTLLEEPYLKYVRMCIYSELGDKAEYEYKMSMDEFNTSFRELVEATEIWQDINLDDVKDVNEERPHGDFFSGVRII